MTKPASQEWFLDVNGKQTGPYSLDEVLGLFREGEIPAAQKVTSERLKGKWITVRELSEALSQETADPTHVLFEAFQAARDKKAQASQPPTSTPEFEPESSPQKPLILATLGLILLGCFW